MRLNVRPLRYSTLLTTILVPVQYPTYFTKYYLLSSIRFATTGGFANTYNSFRGTKQNPPDVIAAGNDPTLNDYRIRDIHFGTHVFDGVTYSWQRGNGW